MKSQRFTYWPTGNSAISFMTYHITALKKGASLPPYQGVMIFLKNLIGGMVDTR